MLTWRKPSSETLRAFVERQATLEYSYAAVGATATTPPPGYVVDHTRVKLGQGVEVFQAARDAMRNWEHFRLGWVDIQRPGPPLAAGGVATIMLRAGGLWWLNACRIVYTFDETTPTRRFGFAYGTLTEHAESGEERFMIEQDSAGDVWYDILAFSHPQHPLARFARFFVRRLQKRFGRDSAKAMQRAVAGSAKKTGD